jgi:hypothetical protein
LAALKREFGFACLGQEIRDTHLPRGRLEVLAVEIVPDLHRQFGLRIITCAVSLHAHGRAASQATVGVEGEQARLGLVDHRERQAAMILRCHGPMRNAINVWGRRASGVIEIKP